MRRHRGDLFHLAGTCGRRLAVARTRTSAVGAEIDAAGCNRDRDAKGQRADELPLRQSRRRAETASGRAGRRPGRSARAGPGLTGGSSPAIVFCLQLQHVAAALGEDFACGFSRPHRHPPRRAERHLGKLHQLEIVRRRHLLAGGAASIPRQAAQARSRDDAPAPPANATERARLQENALHRVAAAENERELHAALRVRTGHGLGQEAAGRRA